MSTASKHIALTIGAILAVAVSGGLSFSGVHAEEKSKSATTIDEEELTERIVEEVMIRLQEGDVLDRAIEAGHADLDRRLGR